MKTRIFHHYQNILHVKYEISYWAFVIVNDDRAREINNVNIYHISTGPYSISKTNHLLNNRILAINNIYFSQTCINLRMSKHNKN